MPRPPPKLPPADEMQKIALNALKDFKGQINELESAIGMLYLGHTFGWRVLYIIHTVPTIRKYEKILGIVAKDTFPERTNHSDRSLGFKVAEKVSNFWKAVKGEHQVEGFKDKTITSA